MLVMLACGPNSNKLINTLFNQIDNVDFYSYCSVKDFISQSKLRHLAFDRLVFTSKFINTDEDMSTLCDYIRAELNSTEIVMILSKQQRNLEDIFKAYFDSPMYSVMYLDSPTTLNIVNAVKLPIADVKARYYYFDRPERGSVDKKSSKLGLFKGGRKNKNQNNEIQNNVVNTSNSLENGISSNINNVVDSPTETSDDSFVNSSNNTTDANYANIDNYSNQEVYPEAYSLGGDFSNKSENQVATFDDFDLTIGDYGSQHSDSGFIGDDEKDELEKFLQDKMGSNTGVSNENLEVSQFKNTNTEYNNSSVDNRYMQFQDNKEEITSIPKETTISNFNKESVETTSSAEGAVSSVSLDAITLGKINFITGLQGSGATAYLVNVASKLANGGNKVLIVDLDYKSNGLLSFIDVDRFYKNGCNRGIDSKVMYSEDGIDILSNGYGVPIKTDISLFLNKSALTRYAVVLVDCPVDCLDIVPDSVLCNSNVVICCVSDVSKLVETSMKFNDRSIVSLSKEKYLVNNCKVANKLIELDVKERVKNIVLFPNGCWLDNIE